MTPIHRTKRKAVYYVLTDTQIYRTDEILKQIDIWIDAFRYGKLIRAPDVDQIYLNEFEEYSVNTDDETKKLIQYEFNF